jgi:hypothetical protein
VRLHSAQFGAAEFQRSAFSIEGEMDSIRSTFKQSVLLVAFLMCFTHSAMSQSANPFVPADFRVPDKLENKEFRLRMLTVNDVVKDYDAVMTSIEHLKTIWPDSKWPEGLTFEQDLIDLGWHQKEFQIRRSFAYTVVTPSESQVTGCVYINPTSKRGYDAVVFLWARQSELKGGLEQRLYSSVREWIHKDWPFKKVAYPGRDISWDAWRSLPDEKR